MDKVKIIFRKAKNPYTNKYEIVAFMPELPANYGRILSYMHIGQHGEADLGFYHETKKATAEEYNPLLKELKSIYDDCILVVKQKLYYKDLYKAWK